MQPPYAAGCNHWPRPKSILLMHIARVPDGPAPIALKLMHLGPPAYTLTSPETINAERLIVIVNIDHV